MTVNSEKNRVAYLRNGTMSPLPVSFPFQMQSDLLVIETVIATGVQTTKVLTTDYTITGTPDANGFYPNGGAVVPLAANDNVKWTIIRNPTLTQLVQHVDNDPMPAASVDNPLDKLTMIAQRLDDRLDRALVLPDGDALNSVTIPPLVDRAGKYMTFDAATGDIKPSAVPVATVETAVAAVLSGAASTAVDAKFPLVFSLTRGFAQGKTLAQVDAEAVSVGGVLLIDMAYNLPAGTTLNSKHLWFVGGKLTLGAYDLTLNGPALTAPDRQIFDSSAVGKVKGKITGQICLDWWGTTSASTADDADADAGNDCLAFATQSISVNGEQPQIYCTKDRYHLSRPWEKPSSEFSPSLDGRGAVLLYAGIGSDLPALRWIGVSGNLVMASIRNLQFDGDATSWGLEIQGQCGINLSGLQFRTNNTALVLHNKISGQYTEFVRWNDCVFSCNRAWHYKRTSGNGSFHASGPAGNVIVKDPSPVTNARIKVDAGAIIYNAPFSAHFFPTTVAYPLIEAGSAAYWMTHDDLCIENFWASTATLPIITGSLTAATHTGSINSWGGSFDNSLKLLESTSILVDGIVRGRRKGMRLTAVMSNFGINVPVESAGSTNWLLEIHINLNNYYWTGLVHVCSSAFGTHDATVLDTGATGGSNYGVWGSPAFSWNGSVLAITNANYVTDLNPECVIIGCTDLGKTV